MATRRSRPRPEFAAARKYDDNICGTRFPKESSTKTTIILITLQASGHTRQYRVIYECFRPHTPIKTDSRSERPPITITTLGAPEARTVFTTDGHARFSKHFNTRDVSDKCYTYTYCYYRYYYMYILYVFRCTWTVRNRVGGAPKIKRIRIFCRTEKRALIRLIYGIFFFVFSRGFSL